MRSQGKNHLGRCSKAGRSAPYWLFKVACHGPPLRTATDDLLGTGENKENYISSNAGIVQAWNYSGPRSAFTSNSTPIPQFTRSGLPPPHAQRPRPAPYAGNAQLTQLALASLANLGCYAQGGGILTPPAYGTNGNASRNLFRGPSYNNVDFSVSKIWHLKERYSAQFRAEFFNIFNRADFAAPGVDPTAAGFGYATSTPDSSNPVLSSGGPRHIQFRVKDEELKLRRISALGAIKNSVQSAKWQRDWH